MSQCVTLNVAAWNTLTGNRTLELSEIVTDEVFLPFFVDPMPYWLYPSLTQPF